MLDWWKRLRGAARAERKLMAWHAPGRPVWSARDASVFAREGYAKNAVAYRCVRLIAEAAASAPLRVGPTDHPLAALLARPNPEQTGVELLEAFFGHLQVGGNAYLEAAMLDDAPPRELYVLRPDRMSVIPGPDGWPIGWEHRVGGQVRRFERDPVSNDAPVLHLKLFHPADDWGGMLSFFAPPAGEPATAETAANETRVLSQVARRPFRPAHVRARRDGAGDVSVTWIRQARFGGLSWAAGEPPIGEPSERYLVEILDGAGEVVRSAEPAAESFTYAAADQTADFGAPPASLRVRIGQIGANGLPGLKTERTITL